MVDLVKLRKKAKERQESEAAAAALATVRQPPPDPPQPPGPAAPAAVEPLPAKARRREKQAVVVPPDAASSVETEAADATVAVARPRRAIPGGAERLERFMETAGTLAAATEAAAQSQTADAGQIELLTFMIGTEQYAVGIDTIVEIIPPRPPTRVPNAESSIVGVISLRGTMVTLLDVHRKLGHRDVSGSDPRVVVVERAGETVGFLVDRVLRVIKIDPNEIATHPVATPTEQSEYIWGVFQQGKSIFILLDLEKLILPR